MRQTLKTKRAMLVYQVGIANVFAVTSFNLADFGRDARRLLQSDFRTCESFARGLAVAGTLVSSAHCNQAGDIVNALWDEDLDSAPFSDKFHPVTSMAVSRPKDYTVRKTGDNYGLYFRGSLAESGIFATRKTALKHMQIAENERRAGGVK